MDALRRTSGRQHGKKAKNIAGLKHKYAAVKKKIEGAVRAGKLSKREAEKKLIAIRKELKIGGQRRKLEGRAGSKLEGGKRRYIEIQRKLEHAIKEGKISHEDARKKLAEVSKALFGRSNEKRREHEHENLKRHYAELLRKVEHALKEGKISREDAHKKLSAVRKELERRKKKAAHKARNKQPRKERSNAEALKRRYAELQRRLEIEVKEGQMTRDEAREKLREARSALIEQAKKSRVRR